MNRLEYQSSRDASLRRKLLFWRTVAGVLAMVLCTLGLLWASQQPVTYWQSMKYTIMHPNGTPAR